jgi:hypothetical protein
LTPLKNDIKGNGIKPTSKNLAYRFGWIRSVFSSWTHVNPSPLDYWENSENINQAFENGKSHYRQDPHLALYWILHFGLLGDPRYEEIKGIVQDSRDSLIRGATAFIDNPDEVAKYMIEEVSLSARLDKIKTRLQIGEASIEQKVKIYLSQFDRHPKDVVSLLQNLVELDVGALVSQYLKQYSYKVGYSYLFALYGDEDIDRWFGTFLQECWEHLGGACLITPDGRFYENKFRNSRTDWGDTQYLLDLIEPVFDKLSFENQDKALTIIYNSGACEIQKKKSRFDELLKHHKDSVLAADKDSTNMGESLQPGGVSAQCRTVDFIIKLSESKADEQLRFIKEAMNSNKIAKTCTIEGVICHYIIVLWLAKEFKGKKAKKEQLIRELVEHYDLRYKDYQNDNPLTELDFKTQKEADKILKKYLL